MDKFRFLRIEKEIHYHYLQRVIEHVDTALICLDKDQNIQLINRSAKDLLQIPKIRDLKSLEKIDRNLVSLIRGIRTGQREMISLIRYGKILNLTVRATEFTLEKDTYKIVSLHDIKPELDEQEVDSWQKLVRILTHEITNSTIPITNMIAVAREFLVNGDGKPKKIPGLNKEEINDLVESLAIAESRSKGLVNFVQTTKSLTRIPKPSFREIKVKDLFIRIKDLFKKELELSNIELKFTLKTPDLVLKADLELIEQVLINLIRNSIEAFKETPEPQIELLAEYNNTGRPTIKVRDNGIGINKENLNQIFIPFYSTKKDGSGIGLSLSRQIMKLHKGRIEVESEKGKGTCVRLEF
jgi:nitrogen fixation/metabolism regulation signal transduction histidine kinase